MRNLSRSVVCGGLLAVACVGQTTLEERPPGLVDGVAGQGPIGGSNLVGVTTQGGAFVSLSVSVGGSSFTIASGTAVAEASAEAPNYSRSCLSAALERQATAEGGASATMPEAAGVAAAGTPGFNVSAAELGLGAGDLTVLVLFDQSGSMSGGWDERSKWQVANDSLINALEPVLDLITIGTIFFPQPNGCSVAALDSGQQIDFLSGRNFRARWEQTADSRGPSGNTPLHLAMQIADMAIENACRLGLLERRFRVVIVTDGEPNCGVDVSQLPLLPAEWHRLGVETRVMGLPGSQGALELMDQIAQAGGTEKCLSLGSPQQMQSQMQAALM